MSDQTKTTTDQSQAQAAILRKVNLTSLATTLMVDDRSLSAKDAVRLAKEALEAGALALEAQTTHDQGAGLAAVGNDTGSSTTEAASADAETNKEIMRAPTSEPSTVAEDGADQRGDSGVEIATERQQCKQTVTLRDGYRANGRGMQSHYIQRRCRKKAAPNNPNGFCTQHARCKW